MRSAKNCIFGTDRRQAGKCEKEGVRRKGGEPARKIQRGEVTVLVALTETCMEKHRRAAH